MTSLQFCCRKCYSTHGINSIHSIAFPQKNHEESPHSQKASLTPQPPISIFTAVKIQIHCSEIQNTLQCDF